MIRRQACMLYTLNVSSRHPAQKAYVHPFGFEIQPKKFGRLAAKVAGCRAMQVAIITVGAGDRRDHLLIKCQHDASSI